MKWRTFSNWFKTHRELVRELDECKDDHARYIKQKERERSERESYFFKYCDEKARADGLEVKVKQLEADKQLLLAAMTGVGTEIYRQFQKANAVPQGESR